MREVGEDVPENAVHLRWFQHCSMVHDWGTGGLWYALASKQHKRMRKTSMDCSQCLP